MASNDEVVNPSRRRFLQGRISPTPSDASEFNVELVECSRGLVSDLSTSVVTYSVTNSGKKRVSILVKYIGERAQVIKLLHLGPNERYEGAWTETIPQSRKSCSIEVEARFHKATITRRHNFDGV